MILFFVQFVVVGVHSAKFDNEKDSEAIRNAVLRYGISHPVKLEFQIPLIFQSIYFPFSEKIEHRQKVMVRCSVYEKPMFWFHSLFCWHFVYQCSLLLIFNFVNILWLLNFCLIKCAPPNLIIYFLLLGCQRRRHVSLEELGYKFVANICYSWPWW